MVCRLLLYQMILALGLCACVRQEEKPATAGKAPVPVVLARAEQRRVPLEVLAFGNCEATASVTVKARVTGQLQQVHFREGDEVRAGQLLFTIDPQPFELLVRQAEATLARDRAQQQNARLKAERFAQLQRQGFVSQQESDQTTADAAAYDALLRVDQANLDSARLQLDYCRITAPQHGRTGSLLADPGTLVRAGEGDGLVVIQQLAPMAVSFTLPEVQLAAVRGAAADRKLMVRVGGDKAESALEEGHLTFIDNAVDSATGTIRLKAEFSNRSRRLWPGAFARVVLTLGERPAAVTIPDVAVQTGQQGPFVFVAADDGTVQPRPVKVGLHWNGLAVIDEGVTAGDQVVVDGQMRLYPGAKVTSGKQGEGGAAATGGEKTGS